MSVDINHEGPYLVAIEADDEAAFAAGPVEIKQRGFTHVAYLPHTLYHAFPRYRFVYNKR